MIIRTRLSHTFSTTHVLMNLMSNDLILPLFLFCFMNHKEIAQTSFDCRFLWNASYRHANQTIHNLARSMMLHSTLMWPDTVNLDHEPNENACQLFWSVPPINPLLSIDFPLTNLYNRFLAEQSMLLLRESQEYSHRDRETEVDLVTMIVLIYIPQNQSPP